MEILTKAYNITSKYGVSLYNFGPFLSYVNSKIGICIDINDVKYGFLTRNFSFDNLNDFEDFIKKYSYYKNTLKNKSILSLNDYQTISPKINYDFEKEAEINKLNEKKEIETIIEESSSLYSYVENLYNERLDQLILRDKARMAMNDKLLEYKENLYNFYGKEYQEEINSMLDETINKYQIKIKISLKTLDSLLDKLKSKTTLEEIKIDFKNIIMTIKDFEIDKDYLGLLYDLYLFRNKIYVIEKMNECIVLELDKEVRITPQELKNRLEAIKNSIVFNNTKDKFVNISINDIEQKYNTVFSIKEYNIPNFLNNTEFVKLELTEVVHENDENVRNEYISQYESLNKDDKNCLLILFSPFRKIINCILKSVENNTFESTKFDAFKDFYISVLEKINMIDNLLYKEKYFESIDFTSFETFIASLKFIVDKLIKLDFIANFEEKYWSYQKDDSLIFASREIIKASDSSILCMLLQPGSRILYSKQKLRIDNDKFVVEDNDDIFILKSKNIFNKLDSNEKVKDYKPIIRKEYINGKVLDVVIGMEEAGIYKYDNYIIGAIQNERV